MSRVPLPANVRAWTADPLQREVTLALERIAGHPDVAHVAVMPDVHLAEDVCIGTVVATRTMLFPSAVGGDIGCGMAALRFEAQADLLSNAERAAAILGGMYRVVPALRHGGPTLRGELPQELRDTPLSEAGLERRKARDGLVEFATLGRGNHFAEWQSEDDGRLWLMLHSGSRAMGQAVRDHHLRSARSGTGGLTGIEAASPAGAAYLSDVAWALAYAAASRRAMVGALAELIHDLFSVEPDWSSYVDCQHNHARLETHGKEQLWVHRKGAVSAGLREPGIIPGSMGSESFHTSGLGCEEALCSSSHGAGRAMSRTDARRRISVRQLERELQGVWYDHRLSTRLTDEAPSAYKDVRRVMRAQAELTTIVRRLVPLLGYKGT